MHSLKPFSCSSLLGQQAQATAVGAWGTAADHHLGGGRQHPTAAHTARMAHTHGRSTHGVLAHTTHPNPYRLDEVRDFLYVALRSQERQSVALKALVEALEARKPDEEWLEQAQVWRVRARGRDVCVRV
jgi:hypothetical protein